MTLATPQDYWISPNALHIERNAMGMPDYIQASCVSGAHILCFMKGIKGLEYDAGHNYRRWKLQAFPTTFLTHDAKYVYAAIPRPSAAGRIENALVVFPSELLDIYGKNEAEEQIGSEDFYYVFLQGKLSSSGDNGTTNRIWEKELDFGYLDSNAAYDAGPKDAAWYQYNAVSELTTFLKNLTMKAGTIFQNLFVNKLHIKSFGDQGGAISFENGGGEIEKVAVFSNLSDQAAKDIVTPKYLHDRESKVEQKYLRKDQDDETEFGLTMKSLSVAENANVQGFLNVVKGSTLKGTTNTETIVNSGDITTKNLKVTGKATFFELVIQKIKSVGGSAIFSPADGFDIDAWEYDELKQTYYLYWKAEDGETSIQNKWKAGDQALCQNFNKVSQPSTLDPQPSTSNTYWWALVTSRSQSPVQRYVIGQYNIATASDRFHYIAVSAKDNEYDGTLEPVIGDSVVQLGYRGTDDPERQSAIYIAAYDSLDPEIKPPFFAQYKGIKTFELSKYRRSYFDANNAEFIGTFKVSGDKTIEDYINEKIDEKEDIHISYREFIYRASSSEPAKPTFTKKSEVSVWSFSIPTPASGEKVYQCSAMATYDKDAQDYLYGDWSDVTELNPDSSEGTPAIDIVVKPGTVSFSTKADGKTAESYKEVNIFCYRKDALLQPTYKPSGNILTNCAVFGTPSWDETTRSLSVRLNIPDSAYKRLTTPLNKTQYYIAPVSACANICLTIDGHDYWAAIPIGIDINSTMYNFQVDADGLRSEYSTLTGEGGRIAVAESRISQNANAIGLKVSRSDIETSLDNVNELPIGVLTADMGDWYTLRLTSTCRAWGSWATGRYYAMGALVIYHRELYKCIKSMTSSSAANAPDIDPSSWQIADKYAYQSWAPSTYYEAGQSVQYSGTYYRCILAHTSRNAISPTSTSGPTYWTPSSLCVHNVLAEGETSKAGYKSPFGGRMYEFYVLGKSDYETQQLYTQDFATCQVEANKSYTLSFWARTDAEGFTVSRAVGIQGRHSSLITAFNKGLIYQGWQQYYVTFTPSANGSFSVKFLINLSSSTFTSAKSFVIAGVKLEKGESATMLKPLADGGSTTKNLLATGIDIEHKKITLTSDNLDCYNNAGDKTMWLDEHGDLTIAGALMQTIQSINYQGQNNHLLRNETENLDGLQPAASRPVSSISSIAYLDVWRCANVIHIAADSKSYFLPFWLSPNCYCRTKRVDENGIFRPITKEDMLKLVGKKLVIYGSNNGSEAYLYRNPEVTPDSDDTYVYQGDSTPWDGQRIGTTQVMIYQFTHGFVRKAGFTTYYEAFWWQGIYAGTETPWD